MRNNLIVAAGCLAVIIPGLLTAGCNARSTSAAPVAVPLPMGGNISGKLAAIDYGRHHLTIRATNGATYQVNASDASVYLNGREASFSDLSQGNSASVVAIAMDQKTLEIEAQRVNVVIPASQNSAIPTASQPASHNESKEGTVHPSLVRQRTLPTSATGDLSRAVRQVVPQSALLDHTSANHGDPTDAAQLPAEGIQHATAPKDTSVLAHSPIHHQSTDEDAPIGTGETPGDGTQNTPHDQANGRHRRHSHNSGDNANPGAWTEQENRKGRSKEWGAEAQQIQTDDTEPPHSSRHHAQNGGSDNGSEADQLTPAERRDLEKGEQAIEKNAGD